MLSRAITALGITQIVGWGTTYDALGALSGDIARATGWSQSLIFGAFSLSLLVSGLISRQVGRLTDRSGGRAVMTAGSLLAALGLAVIGLFPHPAAYVAGWLGRRKSPWFRVVAIDHAGKRAWSNPIWWDELR